MTAKDFEKRHRQEAIDLSLHACEQFLALLHRTTDLSDNPMVKMMIASHLTLAALTGNARILLETARAADVEANFETCMKWALQRLTNDAISFVKENRKEDFQ